MRRFTAFLLSVAVAAILSPALAQPAMLAPEPQCSAAGAEAQTLAEVIDGGTLRLASGETVLLAGIDMPRGLGGDSKAATESARAELARLAGGAGADVRIVSTGRDRHGRLVAQVFNEAGVLLQAGMVQSGFARARPYPYEVPCLGSLLQLEREARRTKRALWNNDFAVFRAIDPSLILRKGLYVVVEGFVLSVGQGNRVDFLNFGRFWQRDFTVLVDAPVAARLAETGLDTASLAGRRVLVRGVVEDSGGPAIRLNDFRELEILDDD